MTTATKTNDFQSNYNGNVCCTVPWDQINEPGTYICNWSGHLLRVPHDGVASGRSPLLNIVGQDTLYVTKISNDPFITVTKARMLASNFDLNVSF